MTCRAVVVILVGVVVAVSGAPPVAARSPGPGRAVSLVGGVAPTYRPPVDAPVTDPFRAPPQPWAPGNRGLEYATIPGTVVGAIGPGVVTFAGPVAGSLHVTVRHPDGLRSSYSFLAAVRVGEGDAVAAGDPVGVAADRLHLGLRRGDVYLDPAALWGRPVGGGRVHLVPEPSGRSRRSRAPAVPIEPVLPAPGSIVGRARPVDRVDDALAAARRRLRNAIPSPFGARHPP